MPLAETPIARSTRIAVSRQELVNYEAAPALARSPAFLVRHLFSGERASLRPERLLHPGGERSVVIGDHPPRGHGRRRRRLTAIGERERGQHWGFDNLTASARQRCAGHVAGPQCLRPKYA
jgi:hypothetical protein